MWPIGAGPRPLVIMRGLVTAIGPLSIDTYLPTMAADLGVASAQAQLSLAACLVGLAAGQVAVAR